jgi:hypothetical protein
MIAPFERPLGVDQHIGDVLDVADLPLPSPHFQKGGCTPHSLNWSDQTTARGRAAPESQMSRSSFRP